MMMAAGGLVLFFVYHWFYVAPVVAVLIEGILWAGAGGALVGWAYQRSMMDHGRNGAGWGLAFGALFASTLVPSEIVGLVWGPFDTPPSVMGIVRALPLAFLGVPLAVVIAWFLGGRRRIEWSFVAAVAVVHFMIGGSLANFGGRGLTALMFVGFVVFELVAGLVLGTFAKPEDAHAATEHPAAHPEPAAEAAADGPGP